LRGNGENNARVHHTLRAFAVFGQIFPTRADIARIRRLPRHRRKKIPGRVASVMPSRKFILYPALLRLQLRDLSVVAETHYKRKAAAPL